MDHAIRYENRTVRTVKTINSDWAFKYDPSPSEPLQAGEPAFDDTDWVPVALPHTWSTYETTGELHPFMKHPSERDDKYWWYGWGRYRKTFVISPAHQSKAVCIEFDGVQKYCKVFLNGVYAGEHKGGFTSFSLDVSGLIRFGRDNVLAVEVSNRRNDDFGRIPPMTAGNWNVYGGIYRDVRIVIKDRLHIPFQGSAVHEGGTFITTPEVSEEQAQVRVRTYVKNDYPEMKRCSVETIITDADGRIVQTMESAKPIFPGEIAEFDQMSGCIERPRLWSPDSPYLYRVYSIVKDGERIVDTCASPLGIRWYEWNYEEKRLYLNGECVHIHGTNRHQEYPWLGDAIPAWMHEADIRDMKALGHNFLRTCHYTQDKRVYELCDQYGILVCEEVPNIKNIEFGEAVQQQQVKEMIRRDRNHPSIIMWSMGNETNHAADGSWALDEDTTRIIHYRHVAGRGENEPHTHEQLEMENLLRCTIRGWYNADVRNLEPERGQHTGHEKWQHDLALVDGASQRGSLQMNGVMWLYADHGADREYVNSPVLHINPKGWVDAYRVPKLMYYLWQANWTSEPMVYIHPFDWTPAYLGQHRDITVNSNCDSVELRINGEPAGVLHPDREHFHTVVFERIPIRAGTLSVHGIKGDREVSATVVMAGPPAKLALSSSHSMLAADREAIAVITVDIVDQSGIHVYGATNELQFTISGPGKLIGPDTYVSDIDKHEELEGTMYIDAPVGVPIRAAGKPGTIRFTAASPGLQSASIEIAVAAPDDVSRQTGISEPPVNCRGTVESMRRAVVTGQDFIQTANRLQFTVDDLQYAETEAAAYAGHIDAYIRRHNPDTDTGTPAYQALLRLMVQQLEKDKGIIVADDYNFNVQLYNDCIVMDEIVECTALKPEQIVEQKRYYAEMMIMRGVEINRNAEQKRLLKLELNYESLR
ncbi:glycoside hydrolase family 2 protein [Paenibacillus piri]|uniref:Glycoside hydrolase family 2 protein n=1 Tax=Paenibacillus piri TaxID=2547395 RepID=A0A4R5KW69_9BACL|nr:glycoside hydrolase family 2 TIM barrel-domain containing protein [Paenibacillus piri]TDG00262.1 glycoside hydrolase family 2 protein [Paenibacillus piri]